MEIPKLTQPEGSNLCGQTIVAMLAGISLKEAISATNSKGCTNTGDVISALKKYGFRFGSERLLRIPKNWERPNLCIVHLRFGKHWRGHFTLWNDGYFYDPTFKSILSPTFYDAIHSCRITSYVEVIPPVKPKNFMDGFNIIDDALEGK